MPPALRPARAADHAAIDALLRAAFDGAGEARLVAALRAEGAVLVELVAEAEGVVAGHVLFSAAPVDGMPCAALAPLAVAGGMRRRGIGTALLRAGIDRCAAAGAAAVLVLGDPGFYVRLGFAPAAGIAGAPWCGHPAFQALSLRPGAPPPCGIVRYPCAFGMLAEDEAAQPGAPPCP